MSLPSPVYMPSDFNCFATSEQIEEYKVRVIGTEPNTFAGVSQEKTYKGFVCETEMDFIKRVDEINGTIKKKRNVVEKLPLMLELYAVLSVNMHFIEIYPDAKRIFVEKALAFYVRLLIYDFENETNSSMEFSPFVLFYFGQASIEKMKSKLRESWKTFRTIQFSYDIFQINPLESFEILA